jgi:glycerol-3-phosphate dehydrogenase (NAD(P)+)
MARIGIVGGGAFGTAMACVLRRSGHDITLWAREPEVVASINHGARNPQFLDGVELPPGIAATTDLGAAAQDAEFVLLAPPAQHMRSVATLLSDALKKATPVVSCSKGVERESLALMPEVLKEVLPRSPVAVLSGPSFAREIALDLPCGVALACADPAAAVRLARALGGPRFCVHPTGDVVGAAIGGVMKNVIAIASGIAAGRRLGENARATLVTLGLEEAMNLGVAKGARPGTFYGLAGVGDMMLTANSMTSRNTSLGYALGEGRPMPEKAPLCEGFFSTPAVAALARRLYVKMPITFALERVLGGEPVDAAIAAVRMPITFALDGVLNRGESLDTAIGAVLRSAAH